MTTQPILTTADREYATWLGEVERSAILPLKWFILALCLIYWMWSRQWALPATTPFALFVIFAGFTLGEQYFFARDRITPRQVRPFVYASFLFDAGFVSGLVLVDQLDPPVGTAPPIISDYTIFYVLLVLRGFALFRTRAENINGFAIVSILFVITSGLQLRALDMVSFLPAMGRLAFLWGLILITQAFVGLLSRQKEEEFRTRERAIRSASLASLGELSAGVAHEINNPISIIRTYADYLLHSTKKDDPLHEDFQTIRGEAERCQEIVRRMLDFSNPQVGAFESLDIENILRDVTSFVFLEGSEPPIALEKHLERAPAVRGDSVQLKQALINILVNARQILADYTNSPDVPEGFTPRVEVRLGRGAGPRPPVRIAISDNGPGIGPEEAERVFEPFFTRRQKGTGLGLAITRRIIEAHGGTIRLQPRPSGGTTVTVELPIEGEEKG